MQINSFIILIFLFQIFQVCAQSNDNTSLDSTINSRISVSEKFLYEANFDDAEKCLRISKFERSKAFQPHHQLALSIQIFRVKSFKNRLRNIKVDPSKNLESLLALDTLVKRTTNKNILGEYFALIGSAFFSVKKDSTAHQYFLLALRFFEDTGNFYKQAQVRASIISMQQTILQRNGNTKALEDLIWRYDQECEFAQMHDNKYVLSFNTRHLAQIYLRQKIEYENAEKLFNKSLLLRKEIGFKPYLPASYFSLGEVAEKMKKLDQAIMMYEKSIKLADDIKFVRYQFLSRFKIAEIFEKKGNLNKAKEYYVDALNSASANDYFEGIEQAKQKINALLNN